MTFTRIFRFLQLDQREFHFQFQSHPDYPSALAFSDTLNFLDVKNDAYELEKEFWDELPEEFITIYKGNFSLVKKYKTAYLVLSDIEEKISKTQLQEHTDNFVMLFEKAEEKQEKSKLNFSYFVYAFFCLVLLYSVIFQNWEAVVFNGFSILGLYISLEIFNKKFGKESVVLNNFCGSSAKNSKPENCTKIIDYDKINILGLKLSDCSLVYFSALLLLGLFFPATMGVLKILALSSVLVIGYSLYIQIFVEKTFCKICLLIIAILAGQIIISLLFYGNEISVKVLFSSLFAFLISFFSLVFINILMEQKEKYRKSDIKNLRFKRNYDIFKRELLEKDQVNFQSTEIFSLGNKNSKLHISLVSNPFCGYCKDAHRILDRLMKKYPENISAQIRFNYFEDNKKDEELTDLISNFKTIWETKPGDEFLQSVENWFEKRTVQNSKSTETRDLSVIIKTAEENRDFGFTFTPLFLINGYPFPEKYDREDIFYFIDELLEDEEFENEKTPNS